MGIKRGQADLGVLLSVTVAPSAGSEGWTLERMHSSPEKILQPPPDDLGLIRMFIYFMCVFRQMSFLRHLGFLRQRLLHHVAQISKVFRQMSRHVATFD